MIKILLGKEPDLNYADRYGRTALHHAAMASNVDAVRILLEKKENKHGAINVDA